MFVSCSNMTVTTYCCCRCRCTLHFVAATKQQYATYNVVYLSYHLLSVVVRLIFRCCLAEIAADDAAAVPFEDSIKFGSRTGINEATSFDFRGEAEMLERSELSYFICDMTNHKSLHAIIV